jgi:hypothetical protein
VRALRPVLAALLLGLGLTLGAGTAIPRLVSACSCVAPQALAAYAGPDTVIFSGTVVGEDGDGVRVGVERWFSGSGAAPVVLIAGDFGNGASCGVGSRPAVGSRWLWVAFRQEGDGLANPLDAGAVQINICQPFADLATPAGTALLAEAVETFGDDGALPTAAPGGGEAPGGGGASDPVLVVAVVAVVAAILAGVLVLGIAVLVASRRRRPAG